MSLNAAIPQGPLVDRNGYITIEWRQWLRQVEPLVTTVLLSVTNNFSNTVSPNVDADKSEEVEPFVQGLTGPQGNPGPTGSQGPAGPAIFLTAEEGEQEIIFIRA